MYTKSVFIDAISEKDRKNFYKDLTIMGAINLPVPDEMVARWKAIRMVNATLDTQECVSRVISSVADENGFVIRLNILD